LTKKRRLRIEGEREVLTERQKGKRQNEGRRKGGKKGDRGE